MSYPSYPEYENTDVDWLDQMPSHWTVKRLRHVTNLNPGKSRVRGYDAEMETTFLPMEAVGEDGSLDLAATKRLSEVIDGYTYFEENDVAYAKITPCFENGKAAILRGLKNGIGFGTTELTVLRPHIEQTMPDYLFRVITSEPFRSLGESSMYGAGGQKRVPDDFARNFSIPWPPLPEQNQIARFLDHQTARIDALIAEQQRLIELLKEKRQAVISHSVTKGLDPDVAMKDSGVEWLEEVPAHWYIAKFLRYVHIAEGQVDPRVEPFKQMPLVAPNHIESATGKLLGLETAEEQGAESGKYLCKKGDIIYSKIRPTLRKAYLTNQDCLCSADMYPLRPEQGLQNRYLFWMILSESFSRLTILESERVAMPKINRESLNEIYLTIPPEEEQEAISDHIDSAIKDHDELESIANKSIDTLRERRSALISAAVTGKIDVRDWELPSSETFSEASSVEGVTA